MALPEKQPAADVESPVVIEFVPPLPQLPARSVVQNKENEHRSGEFLNGKAHSVGRLCGQAQRAAVDSAGRIAFRVREMRSRAEMRLRFLKQEEPIRLLAFIGAGAFVCGCIARIWRSDSYEPRRN